MGIQTVGENDVPFMKRLKKEDSLEQRETQAAELSSLLVQPCTWAPAKSYQEGVSVTQPQPLSADSKAVLGKQPLTPTPPLLITPTSAWG